MMKPRTIKQLVLVGCLFGAAGAAQAGGVFKWVDSRGITHYDDQNLLAERLTRATIARGLVEADPKATVSAEFVQAIARQCQDLRERSASYAGAQALYASDPAGNQYQLNERQVALERATLASEARRYCRPLAAQLILQEVREERRLAALRSESASQTATASGDSGY